MTAVDDAVARALQTVPDPCMVAAGAPTSIVDLGLVDDVEVEDGQARVTITLTEPGCPFTHHIISELTDALEAVEGIDSVRVLPRWAPMWTEARMTEAGRRTLAGARARASLAARQAEAGTGPVLERRTSAAG